MKVILVDDEPPGRLALRQQLAGLPDAEIVAECADAASAANNSTNANSFNFMSPPPSSTLSEAEAG